MICARCWKEKAEYIEYYDMQIQYICSRCLCVYKLSGDILCYSSFEDFISAEGKNIMICTCEYCSRRRSNIIERINAAKRKK